MKKKVVKRERDPEKRPNKLDNHIMQALNMAWWKWPARNDIKKEARVKLQDGNYKNGNPKYIYKFRCAACKDLHDKVDINHIEPRICIKSGFSTLDEWITRTFCDTSNLEALCRPCHTKLTSRDATLRAEHKRNAKVIE